MEEGYKSLVVLWLEGWVWLLETVEIARIDCKKLCNAEELTGYVELEAATDFKQRTAYL